ncbi:rab family small GTPase [Naegleria gruberi]|uniref:Ras-related protein Rab n=1 Tax=Naegleria gruberi TaxID=5762 RepID=D2VBR1_NAEGR|nr:rab family small GTPase [Naegleria gruberi]EFC45841.1 rab family small GTPase [Naegleria gruberi]|eukprot:XP_002678585.1 rab family small GTPase [Naegleria gruberi strain NEG-M]
MEDDEILHYSTTHDEVLDPTLSMNTIGGGSSSSGGNGIMMMNGDVTTQSNQPSNKTNNHLYKVLVVGDYAVGKTSLIRRYCTGEFTSNYRITIGVDFCLKHIDWNENTSVSLQLWDIAGHERFGAMTRVYYKYAIAAVVCFDISRPSTLDNVKKWRDDINSKVVLPDGVTPIPMILLANKCDLPEITIDKTKMNKFAKENGFIAWFETSARKNVNIDTAFHFLVSHIMKITKNMTLQTQGQNNLGDHKKTELNVVGATQNSNFDKNDKDKENETTSSNKKGCCY